MRRALLALVITAGLAMGTVLPTSALGLTQVTLNCSDGTSWTAVVDTDTLTSLLASVQAMLDYPAGLSCTVLQTPVARFGHVALAASDSFIVAGGRWQVSCFPGLKPTQTNDFFFVNIAVNARLSPTLANPNNAVGSLNETIPAGQTCSSFPNGGALGESHFDATVTCFTFAPTPPPSQTTPVFVTAQVNHLTAQNPDTPFPFVSNPGFVHFGFWDNAQPPGQNPSLSVTPPTDQLEGPPNVAGDATDSSCTSNPFPDHPLGTATGDKQYGNITVHP